MVQVNSCPQCQKELPADTPAGLCPRCLLEAALVPPAEQETIQMQTDREAGNPLPANSVRYFGDYEILEEIARGGMGVVYKARQTTLNRIVALKMILSGELATSEDIERFHLEAQAAANLNHPNIVAIHEVGQHEDRYYFSMDYVEGQSLGERLLSGPVPVRQAAEYVQTISEAVHYAHEAGTLHRDLKPRNVLVSTDGQVQITDFGVAKRLSEDSGLTVTGAVVGTPSYMPPEQAKAQHSQIGPASDVYSLGAVLYELLTGRPPFYASSTVATLLQVVNDSPPDPRTYNPDLPDDLATICLKCLEKSPQLRYSSAQELAEDLGRFLAHEPIHARPASSVRKLDAWFRQRPWVITAAASVVILLLIAVISYQYQANQYLQYQHSHPGHERVSGDRTESLDAWRDFYPLVLCLLMFSFVLYRERAYRLTSWRQWFGDFKLHTDSRPVGNLVRIACLVSCILVLSLGLVLLVKLITAHVWEGSVSMSEFELVAIASWCACMFLVNLARDYREATYGRTEQVIEDHVLEDIRKALFAGDRIGAVKIYRRALPRKGLADANRFIKQLEAQLSEDESGRVSSASSQSSAINWRLVSICLFCEIFVVAIILQVFKPLLFSVTIISLMGGFVVALGAGFLTRSSAANANRAVAAYVALTLLGFALTLVGPRFLLTASDTYSPFSKSWGLGIICGMCLVLSAATPRRVPGKP